MSKIVVNNYKNTMKENIKIYGQAEFEIRDKDGNIKDKWSVTNSVMKVGFAQLALLAGDATAVPFTYLAVGTSNTAVATSQTALAGEITDSGLERHTATISRVTTTETNDTLQLVYLWTASGSKTIEEVGIFNAASGVTMLCRALTTTKTLSSGDSFQVTYKVKFT